MKMFPYITLFILLLLVGSTAKVEGQVVAIGRVTAEVVESVGASAKVTTGFEVAASANEEYGTLASADLNLGTITIHNDVSCNVVMLSATIVNEAGKGMEVETDFSARKKDETGTQTLNLKAKAWMRSGHDSGSYKGTYEMVFAYN